MKYHVQVILATTKRIFQQLSHDHRSLGLIFFAPVILMSILWWLYSEDQQVFDRIAPALLGVFPFIIMFLITSIATLRERRSGTLERVFITPMSRLDFIVGYALAFGILAILQSLIASSFAIGILGMDVVGPQWFVVLVALSNALLGTAIGLLVSAFARTEFQAVQFMPIFVLPQLLVCGLLLPLQQMPDLLEKIAWCLPLTYAVDALNHVALEPEITSSAWRSLAIVIAFVIGGVFLGSLTLRRQEK